MTKRIYKKVMMVGRATTFAVGLAVILALTVGLASTALAGTSVGTRFQLGQTNAVNAVTKLVGTVAGPSLIIDNNSTNASATALDLQVEPGKAPMRVDSDAKVGNLNSDKLDGKDSADFVGAHRFGASPQGYAHEGAGAPTGECMLGEVRLFVGTRAPNGWAWADGELVPIQGNMSLFSVIGTQYGGDGQTTFALPDMRGIEPAGARYMVCHTGVFPQST
jgi:Phage Tail Collar Domain